MEIWAENLIAASEIFKQSENFSILTEELKQNIDIYHLFNDLFGKNGFFISNEDKVFAFGSNYFGRCGFGHNNCVEAPQIVTELCHKNIKQFKIGLNFVLALNEKKQVFGWGQNDDGQLGRGNTSDSGEYLKPEMITSLENIIDISCGFTHSMALNSDGVVYGWGDNTFGQVGCDNKKGWLNYFKQKNNEISKPIQININTFEKIKSIHCSYNQSFAVTSDGFVYNWGSNQAYNLENNLHHFEPKLIKGLSKVISICSSRDNTYFLTNEGIIYFRGEIADNSGDVQEYKYEYKDYKHEYKLYKYEYQEMPKVLVTDVKFNALHSVNDRLQSFGSALSKRGVYYFESNRVSKTEYKNFFDFYLEEYEITFKTIFSNGTETDIVFNEMFEEMGKLGSGSVFKIKDKIDQKVYALKKIKMTKNDKTWEKQKIVKLLFKCSEEFVVKCFGSWIEYNTLFIKMELCSDNLKDIIEEKKRCFGRTSDQLMTSTEFYISSQLLIEILESVQYLHEHNPPIIHRNIHVSNILVNYEPKNGKFLKLAEFGLGTFGSEMTMSHTKFVGNPKYMAPEVASKSASEKTKYSTKADIYSVGRVICDLFEFDIYSQDQNISKNKDLEQKWVQLEQLVDEMMSVRYHKRPTSAQVLEKLNSLQIDKDQIIGQLDLVANHDKKFFHTYLLYKLENKYPKTSENELNKEMSEIEFNNHFNERFEKLDELGSGAFGEVIKVKDKLTKQIYAMKIIEMRIDERNSFLEYLKEVKLMSKCSEKFVVQYFSSWIENDYFYIQMELCSNNLKNIIEEKRECFGRNSLQTMTSTEFFISSQLFKEILECVRYLHDFTPNHIIHRDLKPANILVNYEPKYGRFLKLADFGLATFGSDKTISSARFVGTSIYSPPEIINAINGRPRYSLKTDVYCLGRILLDLFDHDLNNPNQNLLDNEDLKSKWAQLEDLIERMMNTRYHRRPTCKYILENSNIWNIDKAQLNLNIVENYQNKFFHTYLSYKLQNEII